MEWVFVDRVHRFSDVYKMNITTDSIRKNMSCEIYNNYLMQIVELKFNTTMDNNPHPITALDRSLYHPLIRKFSFIPLK